MRSRSARRSGWAGEAGWSSPAGYRLFVVALAGFGLTLAFGGGGARADIQSLAFVRCAAVVLLAAILLFHRGPLVREHKWPVAFLAACVGLVVLQLIPLPPGVWSALPGRAFFADAMTTAGLALPWHSISLTPDATLNALVACLPPVAAFFACLALPRSSRTKVLVVLLALVLLSALLGALQMAAGPQSALRFYRVTNESSAVGLFANRNHQAAFLAMGIPLCCWWLAARDNPIVGQRMKAAAPLFVTAMLLMTIAITGSRAGLAIALAAMIPAAFLLRPAPLLKSRRALAIGGVAVLAAAGLVLANIGRFEAWRRAREANVGEDLRFQLLGDFAEMARSYFPVGSGFGSFPNLYRHVERTEMLTPNYLNHAHMDVVELAIEGGLAGLLLLALLLVWWAWRSVRIWRGPAPTSLASGQQRVAVVITGILLAASLVDYPLRVPLLASLFAFGCAMMLQRPERPEVTSSRRAGSDTHDAGALYSLEGAA